MRIHTEHTENYIHALVASIHKDPASLENWHCLHVTITADPVQICYENILNKLKDTYKNLDCDAVQCTDNDVLLISRDLQPGQLHEMAETLIEDCGAASQSDIILYDLFHDWRTVRKLLLSKAQEAPRKPDSTHKEQYAFGEMTSLKEVFKEAKLLRKARQPLHVLVVEDDPLTRRIVSAGFKEEFALITAASAEEAVANYLLHAPDIVFLDIGLPDTNGFNVLQEIMNLDPDAYVVMFSANSYLENITAALGAGACGFIAKPFKKEKMRHYIQDSALHHRKSA